MFILIKPPSEYVRKRSRGMYAVIITMRPYQNNNIINNYYLQYRQATDL